MEFYFDWIHFASIPLYLRARVDICWSMNFRHTLLPQRTPSPTHTHTLHTHTHTHTHTHLLSHNTHLTSPPNPQGGSREGEQRIHQQHSRRTRRVANRTGAQTRSHAFWGQVSPRLWSGTGGCCPNFGRKMWHGSCWASMQLACWPDSAGTEVQILAHLLVQKYKYWHAPLSCSFGMKCRYTWWKVKMFAVLKVVRWRRWYIYINVGFRIDCRSIVLHRFMSSKGYYCIEYKI